MKRVSRLVLILFLAAVGVLGSFSIASADNIKPPDGITVSPAYQQVSILDNDQSVPVTFKITNNKSIPQRLDLSVHDFNTLSESGGLYFMGVNPTELQKKYGLAKWVSVPAGQVTIAPYANQTVTINLLNTSSLSPGGHYGALMLAILGPLQSPNNANIALHPIASSLMFVTKLGGDTHKLNLSSVAFSRFPLSLPRSVDIRFHNDGNTHLVPRGTVTVLSSSGQILSKGIINENSGLILPETYRHFLVSVNPVTSSYWPGEYKLRVDFRFDGLDQIRSYQTSFWYIPSIDIIILVVVVILGLIIWRLRLYQIIKR